MKKRIVITVGGTGGHVYPALSLAKQLIARDPAIEILFVGGRLRDNRYFDREGFVYQDIDCGSLSLSKPVNSFFSLKSILRGVLQSRRTIKAFQPKLVIGFGSYHTFPALVAAKLCGIPTVLHEANRIPGKVNRLFSRRAALTGVHFPDTGLLMKGKTQQIPIPLREGYRLGTMTPAQARAAYQLDPQMTTILIFGGSQGAQTVNKLAVEAIIRLPEILAKRIQVLHFTGDARSTHQVKEQYEKQGISCVVKDFEKQMDIAWQASDLLISRAGAGTIAEEMEFEVPGILIPYPYAADNHQDSNADFMVSQVKGAVKYVERDLEAKFLTYEITSMLVENRLPGMRQSISEYKQLHHGKDFCSVICELMK